MRQHTQARSRARDFIRAAQERVPNKGSASAITHVLVNGLREEVDADEEVSCLVLGAGWNQIVRGALKDFIVAGSYETADGDGGEDDDESGASKARQGLLWPVQCREDLETVNRAAVFVPSRGEHVPLTPLDLTPVEVNEAGEYLLQKGEDCLRRGRALIRMARELAATSR